MAIVVTAHGYRSWSTDAVQLHPRAPDTPALPPQRQRGLRFTPEVQLLLQTAMLMQMHQLKNTSMLELVYLTKLSPSVLNSKTSALRALLQLGCRVTFNCGGSSKARSSTRSISCLSPPSSCQNQRCPLLPAHCPEANANPFTCQNLCTSQHSYMYSVFWVFPSPSETG